MNTNYVKPAMRVVSINQCATLLDGSGPQVTSVSGNGWLLSNGRSAVSAELSMDGKR